LLPDANLDALRSGPSQKTWLSPIAPAKQMINRAFIFDPQWPHSALSEYHARANIKY